MLARPGRLGGSLQMPEGQAGPMPLALGHRVTVITFPGTRPSQDRTVAGENRLG